MSQTQQMFSTGDFKDYIATTRINVGKSSEESIVIAKGSSVQYDGKTAVIEGQEYNFPKLRSAIKSRWLVDAQEIVGDGDYQRPSAEIEASPATPGQDSVVMGMSVHDEEQAVGSVESIRNNPAGSTQVESQDGREVPVRFKNTADNRDNPVRVDQVSRNANTDVHRQSRPDKKAQFDEHLRQKMENEIEQLKQQVRAQRAPQVREGIQFNNTHNVSEQAAQTAPQPPNNGESGIWDGGKADQVGTVEQTAQSAAQGTAYQNRAAQDQSYDVDNKEGRLQFARQMIPGFDWDFSQHWKTKLSTLNDYADNPSYVCAVYTVESEAMKKHIAAQFPELNLGS